MQKKRFLEDLETIYCLLGERVEKINGLYKFVENDDKKEPKIIKKLLDVCSLNPKKENKIAVINRVTALKEDLLILTLENKENAKDILTKAYKQTASFYIKLHKELLNEIEQKQLLSPFYRKLLLGVHEVGIALTSWQPKWTEHIINKTNSALLSEFGSDEKVMQFLTNNNLFDKNIDGTNADRSYSALKKEKGVWGNFSYAVAFKGEVKAVCKKLEKLIDSLRDENDEIFNAKEAYVSYFSALKEAFLEKGNVISAWQNVDRAWMDIKTPLQIAHPLEYYEDHYKKAVALEWDVRLKSPKNQNADMLKKDILQMYKSVFLAIDTKQQYMQIYEKTTQNIEKTELYISRPMLYYAACFNGLFSAQVVPNDELVSREKGKKIFAYADNVLDSLKTKPFMKISKEVFGQDFIKSWKELIFKKPCIWHKVYKITTIGHELGHILWIDDETERVMNKSGVFKNIEEFKATAGGLNAFFDNIDEALLPHVINDTIKRSVSLIAWQNLNEVEPYYCESLIHLVGFFESGVLRFDDKLLIKTDEKNICALIKWYKNIYANLAKHYLNKRDAKEFLDNFAQKEGKVYLPKNNEIRRFVQYYWELYKKIGREIDESDKRENWL